MGYDSCDIYIYRGGADIILYTGITGVMMNRYDTILTMDECEKDGYSIYQYQLAPPIMRRSSISKNEKNPEDIIRSNAGVRPKSREDRQFRIEYNEDAPYINAATQSKS